MVIFNAQVPLPNDDEIEIFDMPNTPVMPVEEPKVEQPTFITPETSMELNPNNKFFQPEPKVEETINMAQPQEQIINPMDFVETLEQPTETITETPNPVNNNVTNTVQEIRNLITNLQNRGINVKIDEIDLDASYQMNITIEKGN